MSDHVTSLAPCCDLTWLVLSSQSCCADELLEIELDEVGDDAVADPDDVNMVDEIPVEVGSVLAGVVDSTEVIGEEYPKDQE